MAASERAPRPSRRPLPAVSSMQAKCFARHFLENIEVSLAPGYKPDWQMWPIPNPRDGLRVTVRAV
ncbi:hypothetical protein EAV90_00735 [Bradyrhizobium vignae]|nr:hypothetical protein EAV90_00735 [Bradyrhizobium vignae]